MSKYNFYLNGNFYGNGDLHFMEELFIDYVVSMKMYDKDEIIIKIIEMNKDREQRYKKRSS